MLTGKVTQHSHQNTSEVPSLSLRSGLMSYSFKCKLRKSYGRLQGNPLNWLNESGSFSILKTACLASEALWQFVQP
jgi:hypothetical protein